MDTLSAYTAFHRILKVYLTDRDVDTLMTLVTEDICRVGPGVRDAAMGQDAVRTLYEGEVSRLPAPIAFQISGYREASPLEGVFTCFARINTTIETGGRQESHPARLTVTLVRRDGELLASQIHMSAASQEQKELEFSPVQQSLSEELLFNNEVCGVMQYALYEDESMVIGRINQEAARIMEISPQDILNRKPIQMKSTVDPEELLVAQGRAALEVGASTVPQEYRAQGQEGMITWVVGYSSALGRFIDEDGRKYKVLQSIFIDIDAKKRSELELQEYILEQQMDAYQVGFEETLRGLGIGIWYTMDDPEYGVLLYMNEIAAEAVAMTEDTEPVTAFRELQNHVYPDDLADFLQYYQDICDNGRAEYTFRYVHETKGIRYIQSSGWWDGQQRRGCHLDVTERVEREQQYQQTLERTNAALKEALEAAQRANAAKTRFLSNMSHDIRTPMNAIIGFTTIAERRIDDIEKVQDCLTKILSSSEHLLGLINDILDMSRIEAGKTKVEIGKTTVSEIIRNVMSLIQPQIQSKQIHFHVDTLDVRDEYIYADALKMRQVLLNILGNAVKFTPAEGTVSMKIAQFPSQAQDCAAYRFIISDTGVGMSESFISHIFEPFEREKSSTISGTTGTGLGMAITKNLVDMMGGSISVKSRLGEGSEFTVEMEFQLQTDVPMNRRMEELKGLRVLVVDDDFHTCESITKMLSGVGMRTDWTIVAREALHRVQMACDENDPFYGYIIDWIMPEMSGIELTRRIRKTVGNDTPIVVLTAYDWEDIASEAREAGVTAFCTKPLFLSDLTKALLNFPEEKNPEEDTEALTAGWKDRILLVEDNELNSEIAKELLEEKGLLVDTAFDGAEAVKLLSASKPGDYRLVLMDVQMPVMDGYEATRQIRRSGREDLHELPIIAMTANAFQEDRDAAIAAGMNDHLAKPLDLHKVAEVLSHYLE